MQRSISTNHVLLYEYADCKAMPKKEHRHNVIHLQLYGNANILFMDCVVAFIGCHSVKPHFHISVYNGVLANVATGSH